VSPLLTSSEREATIDMSNVAICGFGRIGRSMLRSAISRDLFVPVAICDIVDIDAMAAVFKVDTNYGVWPEDVHAEGDNLVIGSRRIKYINSREHLPDWEALGVELVIDCTGRATTRPGAQAHLDRGAKRVLVSAPSKTLDDCDAVLLRGVNLESFNPEVHQVISMASCTTNALAPVVKVLRETVGIRYGLFSTVHAYTNTQTVADQPMKDRRDSWAAAENIIPASSGAAKALRFIWPDLEITGKAYRVPVRTGSIVELNVVTERETSRDEVNDAFVKAAASTDLAGVLAVLEDQWASSRIVGETHSSIVDLPLTQVQNGTFVSVAAWYDNESGYAARFAETAATVGGIAP
jgi:glyceraldehyde 3-phosphate dehydrogenase